MHFFCLWFLISARLAEEKVALQKQCEESVTAKVEETEQLKLRLEDVQQELLLAKNQVCLKQRDFILHFFALDNLSFVLSFVHALT